MKNLFLALPVMEESVYLPELLNCLNNQTYKDFILYACVNQPDAWWDDNTKYQTCEDNRRSLALLKRSYGFDIHIIDKSSRGKGWKGNYYGVGWARKTAMDAINEIANDEDIIVSIDADTYYPPEYLKSILGIFKSNPVKIALSNPYYHKITGNEQIDRAILRYEIYMRNYSLNMWRIRNPYNFTALGSAIALPVWAYRKVGGITPHKSGEDFYFLQKLIKSGELILWNKIKVYPSSRKSGRVFFGTGPAVIKGLKNDWRSYPVYQYSLFDKVKNTYDQFGKLFKKDISTPMDKFIKNQFGEENIWEPLRNNYKTVDKFKKACSDKIDGLRILQFLRSENKKQELKDEQSLKDFLMVYFDAEEINSIDINWDNFSFGSSTISGLNVIRNLMVSKEYKMQKMDYFK